MTSATWTIGRLLQWTAGFLKERGSESPRLEAEVLLAHALGCKRIELYTRFEEEPSEAVRADYRGLVKQRSEGKPVAYLVGRREFYSLDFAVSPAVLVPRPETEFLVVALLDAAKGRTPSARPEGWTVADVGTGSGILAVVAALKLPGSHVTAVDRSPAALDVARANAAAHRVADRIEFVESDLFAQVEPGRRFDFIVSNPPYVATAEMDELPRDVRDFEPREALEAGPRGTEVIERLIPQAAERLVPGGGLYVEHSPHLREAVNRLLAESGKFDVLPTIEDHGRRPRIAAARRR